MDIFFKDLNLAKLSDSTYFQKSRNFILYTIVYKLSNRNCRVHDNYFVAVTRCWNVSYVNSAVADEYIGKLTLMKQVSLLQSYVFSTSCILKKFKYHLLTFFYNLDLVCRTFLRTQFLIENLYRFMSNIIFNNTIQNSF